MVLTGLRTYCADRTETQTTVDIDTNINTDCGAGREFPPSPMWQAAPARYMKGD